MTQVSVIGSGKIAELSIFAVIAAATLFLLWRAMKGKTVKLRHITMVDAIPDIVDRAVETGKPIHCGAGEYAYLSGMFTPMTIAGMNVLRYTTRLCFRKGARIIAHVACNPEAFPLIDGIVREAAVAEGHPEKYNRDDIHWFGPTEQNWQGGLIADILSQGSAALIMVGAITGRTIPAMGATHANGGVVMGGTARYMHNGSWAAMADYSLFSEDVYAAGAITSNDPQVTSIQAAGDYVKFILIALFAILAIATVLGVPVTGWLSR